MFPPPDYLLARRRLTSPYPVFFDCSHLRDALLTPNSESFANLHVGLLAVESVGAAMHSNVRLDIIFRIIQLLISFLFKLRIPLQETMSWLFQIILSITQYISLTFSYRPLQSFSFAFQNFRILSRLLHLPAPVAVAARLVFADLMLPRFGARWSAEVGVLGFDVGDGGEMVLLGKGYVGVAEAEGVAEGAV
jgi:hypothetical protein